MDCSQCSKCYTFLYDFLDFSFNQSFIKRNSIKNKQIQQVLPLLVNEFKKIIDSVVYFESYMTSSYIDTIYSIIETNGIIKKKYHINEWIEDCFEGVMKNLKIIHQEHSLQKPPSYTGACIGIQKITTIYDDLYD